jgi:hypothetical protein
MTSVRPVEKGVSQCRNVAACGCDNFAKAAEYRARYDRATKTLSPLHGCDMGATWVRHCDTHTPRQKIAVALHFKVLRHVSKHGICNEHRRMTNDPLDGLAL